MSGLSEGLNCSRSPALSTALAVEDIVGPTEPSAASEAVFLINAIIPLDRESSEIFVKNLAASMVFPSDDLAFSAASSKACRPENPLGSRSVVGQKPAYL
jgi:hypothetical protein